MTNTPQPAKRGPRFKPAHRRRVSLNTTISPESSRLILELADREGLSLGMAIDALIGRKRK